MCGEKSTFQSTLSSRRATAGLDERISKRIISIHALLAESDTWTTTPRAANTYFNPRSPRGERRAASVFVRLPPFDFNPRSPHGERPFDPLLFFCFPQISIHALLAESDRHARLQAAFRMHFNPRSPRGERPDPCRAEAVLLMISIHALLAESDNGDPCPNLLAYDFNPRSPRGERQDRPDNNGG